MSAGLADEQMGLKLTEFSAADRERVMELLLSQERVINLLYDKTFPPRRDDARTGGLGAAAAQVATGADLEGEIDALNAELSPVDELTGLTE